MVSIVKAATHGIENSTIQPENILIEHNNFVIVVGVHSNTVLIESSVYGA